MANSSAAAVARAAGALIRRWHSTGLHRAVTGGFTSAAIDAYERGRPTYQHGAVKHMLEQVGALGADHPVHVVDVGAGSGKFTSCLMHLLPSSAAITAVEPTGLRDAIDKLAEAAARSDAQDSPTLRTLSGVAECMPLETASCDVVTVGQAFHWFASAEALTEFHRVLRPRGYLALVWNTRRAVEGTWMRAYEDIIDSYYTPDVPRQQTGAWKAVFEPPTSDGLFGELHSHVVPFEIECTVEVVVARATSISVIAALPEEGKAEAEARVRELLASHSDTAGKERVTMPYDCTTFWSQRL